MSAARSSAGELKCSGRKLAGASGAVISTRVTLTIFFFRCPLHSNTGPRYMLPAAW